MNINDERRRLFGEFPPISTEAWESQIQADLKGADYEKRLVWKTDEGLSVRPYYRAENIEALHHINSLPGEFPYVRGKKPAGNDWQIRQDIHTDNIGMANTLALEAIERGAKGVGFRAKEIFTVEDLSDLIRYIELEKTAVHFIKANEYPFITESFIRIMKLRTARPEFVHGSLGFDPFSYYLLHGDFYNSLTDNLNEAKYLLTGIRRELPNFRMITVSGDLFHNAGAGVVQELAYALASGNEYLAKLTESGLTVDEIAPAIQFTFSIGSDYFLEIAKFRAARMLWANIVNAYQPKEVQSTAMYIHGTTSLWNKTVYDPYVNLLRGTTEAMSGIIGGCDSLSVQPFDLVYRQPDNFSMHIARNTQIILKEESYFDKIGDPAAGSYYIEQLTDSVAAAAWELFLNTEEAGGFLAVAGNGTLKAALEKMGKTRNERIAIRSRFILGTNQYPNSSEIMLDKVEHEPMKEYPGLKLYRASSAYEDMRLTTERYVQSGNQRPSVFLLNIGNLTMRKARAGFALNFFGCAGFEIIDNNGFDTVAEGVATALSSKAPIVVICSSDDEYATLGVECTQELKASAVQPVVIVAGNPTEAIDQLKTAGVDEFIHLRTNALEFLKQIQVRLGIA